jgi:polyisoprenoid-binding protein YceI
MLRRSVAAAVLAAALAGPPAALAQEGAKTYHFGTSEARTIVQFESETSLEVIHGTVKAMSGTADLDFAKGEGKVDLRVPVERMETGLPARDEHMRGEGWLDAKKFPEIAFVAKSLKRVKVEDEKTQRQTWAYEGEITIHGVTKALKGEATLLPIPEEAGRVLGRGTWVKVKTKFQIALKDFDITIPEMSAAKVSPTWDVTVDIFGTTEPPKAKKDDEAKGG